MRPFPETAIKQREQGGRWFSYVQGHVVIHRLIEATGNQFDVAVTSLDMKPIPNSKGGSDTLVIATVALTIPGLGTRQHIGVQVAHERGGEDMVKGAITDGLKKAATLFGVGLEFYGPDYESGEIEQPRQQYQPQRPAYNGSNTEQELRAASNANRYENGNGEQAATEKQVGFIIAVAGKLWQLDPQEVKEWVYSETGITSMSQLTKAQASKVIDMLKAEQAKLQAGIG